jgi:hypothetical protein
VTVKKSTHETATRKQMQIRRMKVSVCESWGGERAREINVCVCVLERRMVVVVGACVDVWMYE